MITAEEQELVIDYNCLKFSEISYYLKYNFLPICLHDNQLTILACEPIAESHQIIENLYPHHSIKLKLTKKKDIYTILQNYLVKHGDTNLTCNLLTTLRPAFSANKTLTNQQAYLLLFLFELTLITLTILPAYFIKITVFTSLILALVILITNLLLFLIGAKSFFKTAKKSSNILTIDRSWPQYTILIALYKEANVASTLVANLEALDYPKESLEIILVLEPDDIETQEALSSLNLAEHYKILTAPPIPPRTKGKALNYALNFVTGKYVVIFDAEDNPEQDQLKKAVLTFEKLPENYCCLQAKLTFYNYSENFLTNLFRLEYTHWFDFILPAMYKIGFPIPLGGSSNHFKTNLLRTICGWDSYNVTEDAELGTRIAISGFKTQILDSYTFEEAPNRMKLWIKQRTRWTKGYIQTFLVYIRYPRLILRHLSLWQYCGILLTFGIRYLFYLLMLPLLFLNLLTIQHYDFITLVTFIILLSNNLLSFFLISKYFFGQQFNLVNIFYNALYNILYLCTIPLSIIQLSFVPHYWYKTPHGLTNDRRNLSTANSKSFS